MVAGAMEAGEPASDSASTRSAPRGFHPLELFFSGVGRINFATFILAMVVVVFAFEAYERLGAVVHWVTGWLAYPILICAAASTLSKRLHDRGLAGWWAALPIIAYPLIRPWPQGIVGGVALGIVLWYGVTLAVLPSHPGFNRFGPKPG